METQKSDLFTRLFNKILKSLLWLCHILYSHVSEKLRNDIRNTIQQTVREELSKVLANNKQGDESDRASETAQSTATSPSTSSTNTTPVSQPSTSQSRGQSSTLSFRQFYQIRETSRQDDFKPSKKQKRGKEASSGNGTKAKQPKEVEIKVGLAYVNSDGVFKTRRNKTHILKVRNDIEKDELIEKAIVKHGNFDQSFDYVSPYVLLYPDFSEVYFVPGTKEAFSLMKYKEAISKDYKKLTFYLCLRDEFQYNQLSDWSSDESEKIKVTEHEKKPTVHLSITDEKDNHTDHESKPTVSTTANKSPILIMDNDDDPLLLLAIHESQQDKNATIANDCEMDDGNMYAEASSLGEALEMKRNDVPNEQYTVIEVTRKKSSSKDI